MQHAQIKSKFRFKFIYVCMSMHVLKNILHCKLCLLYVMLLIEYSTHFFMFLWLTITSKDLFEDGAAEPDLARQGKGLENLWYA